MPLAPYWDLIADAERRSSAVFYFETWDLRSLIGVLRAAEHAGAPVMVGHNGTYLPAVCRWDTRWLDAWGRGARAAAERARVPVALFFNESPFLDWTYAALECGFNVVMYTDERVPYGTRVSRIAALARKAHASGIAVEAELGEIPDSPQAEGAGGATVDRGALTDPGEAERFVKDTGVDALGVLVGNRHPPDGGTVELDIELIGELGRRLKIPLVLHAGSSVARESLREGIKAGIRRVNIGRAVKEPAFHAIAAKVGLPGASYPGYPALGSGREMDLFDGMENAVYEGTLEKLELLG